MRLALYERDGRRRLGLISGADGETLYDVIDAAEALGGGGESSEALRATSGDTVSVIRSPQISDALERLSTRLASEGDAVGAQSARVERDHVRLCAPIERPGKIICLAGNYRAHIAESGLAVPQQNAIITPQLFLKPATALIGDGDEIVISKSNARVGWEVELAVIIGKRGREIAASEAEDYIFGYTILNDISERALNKQIPGREEREMDKFFDWLAGKWFDTFAPCGPWIVTRKDIADPHDLGIRLSLNGEARQEGRSGEMIHRIPETIAYVSSIMTLEPGDIISTGTPVGAGLGDARNSLEDGDEMVCEIEKIGWLRNRVRRAA